MNEFGFSLIVHLYSDDVILIVIFYNLVYADELF